MGVDLVAGQARLELEHPLVVGVLLADVLGVAGAAGHTVGALPAVPATTWNSVQPHAVIVIAEEMMKMCEMTNVSTCVFACLPSIAQITEQHFVLVRMIFAF